MKTLIVLILLCASTAFGFNFTNVFTGGTNNDGTGDTLRLAFGKLNTNDMYLTNLTSVVSNGVASLVASTSNSIATSPSFAPTLTFTNIVSGQLYTNATGRPQFVGVTAVTTYSTVAGAAVQRLMISTQGSALAVVAGYGAQTIVGSLGTTNLGIVCGPVPVGWTWSTSNSVIGAGDAAINLPGTGYIITY